jgi:plastocyanin
MKNRLLLAMLLLATATAGRSAPAELTIIVKGAKGEPVADAVVSLIPLDAPAPPAAEATGEIAQADSEFTSYVNVVQSGSRVLFPNHDNVQHHVYSLSKAKRFELPLYNPGQNESLVFEVAGLVTLGCNIHDWMIAHLLVVPTPWFAKSNALGLATVTAPAGRYRIELWHPRLAAPQIQEITLAPDSSPRREFAVTLKADKRIRRGGATKSGGYR